MEIPINKKFESIFQKIEKYLEEENFYSAQQLYKTLYFRLCKQKDTKGATQLLVGGSCKMLQLGQFNNGVELALILLEHFKNNQMQVNKESVDLIIEIYSNFPGLLSDPTYRRFVKTALSWSSSASNNLQGDPRLHNVFAVVYNSANDFEKAEQHYLRGDNPKEFALVLYGHSLSKELEIIVAKAVLQYLCLSNLKDANILFSTILELDRVTKNPKLTESNFITFLKYLLLTLERDAYPLVQLLQEKYSICIKRDPIFEKYMALINKIYFKVEPQKGFGALLGNLLNSFMQ